MNKNRRDDIVSQLKIPDRVQTGRDVSNSQVELRNNDDPDTVQINGPSGGKFVQILTAIFLNLLALGTGASYGIHNVISSRLDIKKCNVTLDTQNVNDQTMSSKIEPSQCPFTINTTEKTLIATFSIIGMYCTVFFSVPIVVRMGKRISLMIDCLLSLVAFLLMAFAINVEMLYLSKFLLGYVSLTCRSAIQPFICEISNSTIRGFTTSLYVLFYISGQALSLLIANQWIDGWRYVSATFGGLMIICLLALIVWIHESPDWLLEKKFFAKAISALEFYNIDREVLIADEQKRKTKDGKEKSYNEIVSIYEEESKRFINPSTSNTTNWQRKAKQNIVKVIELFKRPDVYKPFILLTFMLGLVDLSGFVVMANYSILLVEEYGYGSDTFVNPSNFMVIVYLSRIPSSLLAMGLLQKFKKRHIYLIVSSILLFTISGIVAFTWLVTSGSITQEEFQGSITYQIIPLVLFVFFYATFSFGYGNIPFSLMGELFPPNASSIANTFAFIFSNVFGFVAVQTALMINDTHGLQYVFFIPAGAIVLSIVLAAIFMPETHGLSMDEIRQIYKKEEDDEEPVVEEEDIPYYQSLRGELNLELMRAIKQRRSVYPWPSVGGAQIVGTVCVQMSPTPGVEQTKKTSRTCSHYAF